MDKLQISWPELANTLQILTPPLKEVLFHAPVRISPVLFLVLLEVSSLYIISIRYLFNYSLVGDANDMQRSSFSEQVG